MADRSVPRERPERMTDEMVPVGDDHGASPYAAERSSPEAPSGTPQAKDAESDKRTPEWRRLHRRLTDVIDNACCGYDAAEDVLDALGLEQVGWQFRRRKDGRPWRTFRDGAPTPPHFANEFFEWRPLYVTAAPSREVPDNAR